MTDLTPDQLATIEARLQKMLNGNYSLQGTLYSNFGGDSSDITAFWNCAPTDIATLIAEVKRLTAVREGK